MKLELWVLILGLGFLLSSMAEIIIRNRHAKKGRHGMKKRHYILKCCGGMPCSNTWNSRQSSSSKSSTQEQLPTESADYGAQDQTGSESSFDSIQLTTTIIPSTSVNSKARQSVSMTYSAILMSSSITPLVNSEKSGNILTNSVQKDTETSTLDLSISTVIMKTVNPQSQIQSSSIPQNLKNEGFSIVNTPLNITSTSSYSTGITSLLSNSLKSTTPMSNILMSSTPISQSTTPTVTIMISSLSSMKASFSSYYSTSTEKTAASSAMAMSNSTEKTAASSAMSATPISTSLKSSIAQANTLTQLSTTTTQTIMTSSLSSLTTSSSSYSPTSSVNIAASSVATLPTETQISQDTSTTEMYISTTGSFTISNTIPSSSLQSSLTLLSQESSTTTVIQTTTELLTTTTPPTTTTLLTTVQSCSTFECKWPCVCNSTDQVMTASGVATASNTTASATASWKVICGKQYIKTFVKVVDNIDGSWNGEIPYNLTETMCCAICMDGGVPGNKKRKKRQVVASNLYGAMDISLIKVFFTNDTSVMEYQTEVRNGSSFIDIFNTYDLTVTILNLTSAPNSKLFSYKNARDENQVSFLSFPVLDLIKQCGILPITKDFSNCATNGKIMGLLTIHHPYPNITGFNSCGSTINYKCGPVTTPWPTCVVTCPPKPVCSINSTLVASDGKYTIPASVGSIKTACGRTYFHQPFTNGTFAENANTCCSVNMSVVTLQNEMDMDCAVQAILGGPGQNYFFAMLVGCYDFWYLCDEKKFLNISEIAVKQEVIYGTITNLRYGLAHPRTLTGGLRIIETHVATANKTVSNRFCEKK